MIGVLAGFVAGALAVFVVSWWRSRPGRGSGQQRTLGVAYDRAPEHGSPARGVRASLLESPRDSESLSDRPGAREQELADDLRGYLGDVGAQHGSDDAMLWVRGGGPSSEFLPLAWNHAGAPPGQAWGTSQQRALVTWAAEEGVVSFDGTDGEPALAAVRVPLEAVAALGASGTVSGALVLHAPAGIRDSRGDLKLWLPRHAERLAQLVELQVTRNEVARQNRRMRALARSAQDLNAGGEDELAARVAESMLDASGAEFAALVAWQSDQRLGVVRYVSPGYPEPVPSAGDAVDAESLVGSVCQDGTPRLWENASALADSDTLFSQGSRPPDVGTLAVLPLRRGKSVIGAIVIGARASGSLRQGDLRTAGFYAQLAGAPLEAAWEIEQVNREARLDVLTGLWNRRHFEEELKRTLDQTDRFGGSCALVLADIDHFKHVNDSYGHPAGDRVLKAVAGVMTELVRTTDVCARFGGEEFCVILPQTGRQGAMELAERIRVRVAGTPILWHGHSITVTSSFGVATYEAGGGPASRTKLFEAADRALYAAKHEGRNCVRVG